MRLHYIISTSYSGTALAWDAMIEAHHGHFVFVTKTTLIYSFGLGLHTLAAMCKSTQPSALREIVNWVSAFELNINKWQWRVYMRRTHGPSLLTRSESRQPGAAILHLSNELCSMHIVFVYWNSRPSSRQHLSYDGCLKVRGEIIRTVLCCIVYWSCAQS